jgi:hypothetical protein
MNKKNRCMIIRNEEDRKKLKELLGDIEEELLENQKPLDPEAAKVLKEQAWDLYTEEQ